MRKTFIVFAVCIVSALIIAVLHSRKVDKEYLWTRTGSGGEVRKAFSVNGVLNEKEAMDAFRQVVDPELQINIVDLGLIYKLAVVGETVKVTMTLTAPTCPYGGILIDKVKKQLFSNTKVQNVHLVLTFNPPWTVERLSPEAKKRLLDVGAGSS